MLLPLLPLTKVQRKQSAHGSMIDETWSANSSEYPQVPQDPAKRLERGAANSFMCALVSSHQSPTRCPLSVSRPPMYPSREGGAEASTALLWANTKKALIGQHKIHKQIVSQLLSSCFGRSGVAAVDALSARAKRRGNDGFHPHCSMMYFIEPLLKTRLRRQAVWLALFIGRKDIP